MTALAKQALIHTEDTKFRQNLSHYTKSDIWYFRKKTLQKILNKRTIIILKTFGLSSLTTIVILLFALNTNAQTYYSRDNGSSNQNNGSAVNFANSIQPNARALINAAINKNLGRIFYVVLAKLKSARLVHGRNSVCFNKDLNRYGNVDAYVQGQGEIGICDSLLYETDDFAAQLLVHESAHLAGISNECGANEIAYKAMRAAGQDPLPNAYDASCSKGFNPLGRH